MEDAPFDKDAKRSVFIDVLDLGRGNYHLKESVATIETWSLGVFHGIDLKLLDVDLIIHEDEVDNRALICRNASPVVERIRLRNIMFLSDHIRIDEPGNIVHAFGDRFISFRLFRHVKVAGNEERKFAMVRKFPRTLKNKLSALFASDCPNMVEVCVRVDKLFV